MKENLNLKAGVVYAWEIRYSLSNKCDIVISLTSYYHQSIVCRSRALD